MFVVNKLSFCVAHGASTSLLEIELNTVVLLAVENISDSATCWLLLPFSLTFFHLYDQNYWFLASALWKWPVLIQLSVPSNLVDWPFCLCWVHDRQIAFATSWNSHGRTWSYFLNPSSFLNTLFLEAIAGVSSSFWRKWDTLSISVSLGPIKSRNSRENGHLGHG